MLICMDIEKKYGTRKIWKPHIDICFKSLGAIEYGFGFIMWCSIRKDWD